MNEVKTSVLGAKPKSAVCTLFEGAYHHGVAALVNSLCRHGYEGTVYVGYKGELPQWVSPGNDEGGLSEFYPTNRVTVRFIRLFVDRHLGTYKPEFMLWVLEHECPDADTCFYFDPDIVILCRWGYFEEWVLGGVALCADIASEMPPTHPYRHMWRRYFEPLGVTLDQDQSIYLNSGFIGAARKHRAFLETWRDLIALSKPAAGDLKYLNNEDPTMLFCIPDQDCLNAATMASQEPLSCMGRDGMGFSGGWVMSHAIGKPKPWEKSPLWDALSRGERPSPADATFLSYAQYPIPIYSRWQLWLKAKALVSAKLLAKARLR